MDLSQTIYTFVACLGSFTICHLFFKILLFIHDKYVWKCVICFFFLKLSVCSSLFPTPLLVLPLGSYRRCQDLWHTFCLISNSVTPSWKYTANGLFHLYVFYTVTWNLLWHFIQFYFQEKIKKADWVTAHLQSTMFT